jgi:hypothetical protein
MLFGRYGITLAVILGLTLTAAAYVALARLIADLSLKQYEANRRDPEQVQMGQLFTAIEQDLRANRQGV